MPANSLPRRVAKRALAPVLNERTYRYAQALAMARYLRSGSLSEPEIELIPYAVREGESALDVGANYGMWTYPLSRAVGPNGRVYAFEPVPFTVDTLRLVVRLLRLRNVEIVPKACGEREGSIEFAVPVQDSGAISAGQSHAAARDDDRTGREQHVRWNATRTISCDVLALDEILPEHEEISLLKADIEGAELFALRGAERTLERHAPTVICEINPWFLEGFQISLEELIAFFAERDYGLYRYLTDPARLEPVADPATVDEDNYVFVPSRRTDRFEVLLSRGG